MFLESGVAIVIIIGLLMYAGMFLIVSKVKNIGQARKSVYIILPNLFIMSGILFFNSYDTTILPPKPKQNLERIDSIGKAEDRIRALESYSESMEIYLNWSRDQMFLLIGILSLMFMMPLFMIAIAIAKPIENTKIETENIS